MNPGVKLSLTGTPRCAGNAVAFPFQANAGGMTIDIIDVFEFGNNDKRHLRDVELVIKEMLNPNAPRHVTTINAYRMFSEMISNFKNYPIRTKFECQRPSL